ncbi:MAG: hypothetical protein K2Y37_23260 [Pirellulales bacterium]|nr:hypothetical protein [Pirellulales bacterium]
MLADDLTKMLSRRQFFSRTAGTVSAGLGAETRYAYDALGRLITMTEANASSGSAADPATSTPGNTTSPTTAYEYYADNQLKKLTDPLAAETRWAYDALGRVAAMTEANASTGAAADPTSPTPGNTSSPTTIYAYDKNSRLTSVTDPLAHVTSYGYDNRDRQTLVREPNPSGGGSTGGPETTTVYDGVGNVVEVITPPNTATSTLNHTAYVYDGRNQLIEIREPGSGGSATGPETLFEYDKAGNRTRLTDPVGNETDFVFDGLNRLSTDTNYNGSTGYTRTYTYDAASNLTTLVDRNRRETVYGYDKLNRQTSEIWYADATTTQVDYLVNYGYDLAGNLTSGVVYTYSGGVLDTSKTIGDYFYYDKLGQAYNQFHLGPQSLPNTKLINSFDVAGNRTSTVAQFNSGSGYATDNTIDRTFDKLSRLESIKQTGSGVSSKLVTVAYNNLSQVLDVHRYAASTASSSAEVAQTYNYYDGQNRVYIIQHKPSISGTAQTQTLLKSEYFADSSLKKEKTEGLAAGGGGSSWYLWDGVHDYAYDPRGQLTGDTHTPYTVSGSSSTAGTTENNEYGYDDAGNREDVDDINGSVTYGTPDDNNELTSDGLFNYTYDHEGNVTQKVRISSASADDHTILYEWDNRNRLVKVTNKNNSGTTTQIVAYLYDAFDRRSVRTVTPTGGTATSDHFVYDGLSRFVIYDFHDTDGTGSTAPTLQHRYLAAIDQVFAQENVGASGTDVVNWLLADRLGSTRVVLYNDGALKQTIDYDPYGNMAVFDASHSPTTAATMILWAQLLYDPAIKQHVSATRIYDAPTGRWTSVDRIGFAGADYDLGRYLGNSPTNGVDPLGTEPSGPKVPLDVDTPIGMLDTIGGYDPPVPEIEDQLWDNVQTLGPYERYYAYWGTLIGQIVGVYQIDNACEGTDVITGAELSPLERAAQGILGTVQLVLTAVGLEQFALAALEAMAARGALAEGAAVAEGAATAEVAPNALVPVSRWGRPGLETNDWVMRGPADWWNYTWSGKWQPWDPVFRNEFAPFGCGQEFAVPPSTLEWPGGAFGIPKGILGQRIYVGPGIPTP